MVEQETERGGGSTVTLKRPLALVRACARVVLPQMDVSFKPPVGGRPARQRDVRFW
jgi:hypothetical protein